MASSYDALSKAQEILDRATEGGAFATFLPNPLGYEGAQARAREILGAEFDDVNVRAYGVRTGWDDAEVRVTADKGAFYSPRGRTSVLGWLPEEDE